MNMILGKKGRLSEKNITKIYIGLLIIGVLLDLGVNITKISYIKVDRDFISDIYSAIFTISILSFSIIALISGLLNSKFYSYELREIFNFPNSPVKMNKFIILSLSNVLLATLILELNYVISSVNILLFLMIESILLIAHTGIKICYLMINKDECVELVKQYYLLLDDQKKLSYDFFSKSLNKLTKAWEDTLKQHDSVNKDIVWNMMGILCGPISKLKEPKYYEFYKYFDSKIKANIVNHSLTFGFSTMIKDIIKIYEKVGASDYDKRDIYAMPLEAIQFYDDKVLLNLNVLSEIMDIQFLDPFKEGKITSTDMEWIYYRYFNALVNNCYCTEETKQELIKKYIHELSRSNSFDRETILLNEEQLALINVLRYRVFQNPNQIERKRIFESLLYETLTNNRFNHNDSYHNYLSVIAQMTYAYIVLETETLTDNFRKDLKYLILSDINMPNVAILNISIIVNMNIRGILKALAKRIETKENCMKKYEYFSMEFKVKSAIWTREFDIRFFFMLYLLYNQEIGHISPMGFFSDWESIEINWKRKIVNEFKRFYDSDSRMLSYSATRMLESLAELLKTDINISENIQQSLFEHINEYECNIIKDWADEPVDLGTNKEITYNELIKIIDREKVYGWDSSYNNNSPVLIRVPDIVCNKKNRNNRAIAYDLKNAIIEAIHKCIKHSSKLQLSFDEKGLITLASFLEKTCFNSRNYSFTDDLCWNKDIRESEIFNKVITLDDNIELIKTNGIYEKFYYSKENFKYNINIIDCELHTLGSKESEEFIEYSKTYNGLYNIEGALFTKTEAIDILQRLYCRQSLAFELMVSFKPDELTVIEFKR